MKGTGNTIPYRILIVDDDPAMRSLLVEELSDTGDFTVTEAEDRKEALQQIEDGQPDIIVTDLRMPSGGLEYLRRLRVVASSCPIIEVTALGDNTTRKEVLECGIDAFFYQTGSNSGPSAHYSSVPGWKSDKPSRIQFVLVLFASLVGSST